MNKTLASLVAGISFLGISCCGELKPVKKTYPPPITEFRLEQKATSLEQLAESIYCLKADVTYELLGDIEKQYHGSGFGYQRKDGYTYLITNQHVLGEPTHNVGFLPAERKRSLVKIVDSEDDFNPKDDIPLEIVFESPELDIAVLRTKRRLPTISRRQIGDSDTLKLGEFAYIMGYPEARFKVASIGMIGNTGNYPLKEHFRDKKHSLKISNSSHTSLSTILNAGNSGGPFFVKRSGEYYWMGIGMDRYEDRKFNNKPDGISTAIESNAIAKVVDYVINHAEEFIKNKDTKFPFMDVD